MTDESRIGAAQTIYALSSGTPPAGIGVVRISGPAAGLALTTLAVGDLPTPRRASLRRLRDAAGAPLDDALVLWFPGSNSVTGEDLAELHLHGGRAVIAGVLGALGSIDGLRPAEPGEFTRRAFENGRIDLAEAEGLADLLAAETEAARIAALRIAEGGLSRVVLDWQQRLLMLAAHVEALIDFSDEDDVREEDEGRGIRQELADVATAIDALEATPPAERLRDGVRVVFGGPVNAGKSTLFNRLAGRDAALVSPVAGTTRDVIEAPVQIGGVPLLLIDTAGLRSDAGEIVEVMGIDRAAQTIAGADIILWFGDAADVPDRDRTILVHARADVRGDAPVQGALVVSAHEGSGIEALRDAVLQRARSLLPPPDGLSLNQRQRKVVAEAAQAVRHAGAEADWLLVAEHLRFALTAFDRLTGRAGTEDMLDALFGRFCIGK
ncbi:tRNA modification GTPase [Sphingomonas zeicaulis]|uniref:tRNA uridine-5-carboxymethylaminomethyl(34) synthesis GTPase MnmE n=1 Tax=Sphingomonas zeicaulis TaxID=1632740 RepID=UPI003D25D465